MAKYQLSTQEQKLLKRHTSKVNYTVQLSGKPTTNLRDFFKRLFLNKLTVISLVIFIGIIITAAIITATSKFGPERSISANGNVLQPFLIGLLPPTWQNGGDVEKIITADQYKILIALQDQGLEIINSEDIVGVGPKRILVTFDPYGYFETLEKSRPFYILGTNEAGQDNWTRVWAGTLSSLGLALLVASVETLIGVAIGAYLGYHAGSKVDNYAMRFVDSLSIVPPLLWFILLSYLMKPGFWSLFVALTAVGWLPPLYQTRMYVLRVKNLDFIRAAKTVGVPEWKLVYKYALPQSLGRILAQFVRRIPIVIFWQASLAFLGFSSSDDFNLGAIINNAKSHIENVWYLLTPTFIVFVITLSLQFVSNGVNRALEPKAGA